MRNGTGFCAQLREDVDETFADLIFWVVFPPPAELLSPHWVPEVQSAWRKLSSALLYFEATVFDPDKHWLVSSYAGISFNAHFTHFSKANSLLRKLTACYSRCMACTRPNLSAVYALFKYLDFFSILALEYICIWSVMTLFPLCTF